MPRKSTAQAVVDGLIANGIDRLYCLPGVQNDGFFDALFDAQERIEVVHCRHEQGAAYMALGQALATGRPAAYCVVPGPGLLNTTAALATAYSTGAKVLALAGQIPQAYIGRELGLLHEVPDQGGMLASLTKWSARIDAPSQAPALVREAFRQLESGRPRPVALECPIDVWSRSAAVDATSAAIADEIPVDEDAIEAAARLLAASQRPLIVVGGGALDASDEVRSVAELLEAPVSCFRMGHGVLDARHRLSVTSTAGHALWAKADVVLAVGTRLQTQQLVWGTDDALRVVRIDIDPMEHARIKRPDVGIVGDAAACLRALADRLRRHPRERSLWSRDIATVKAGIGERFAELEPQMSYLRVIREALGEDGVLVEDLTQVGYVGRLAYPTYKPRTFVCSGYQGTLGWGVATAIGAKMARPEVPVVSLSGDGGFMFNLAELATAVQFGVRVAFVVMDDGAYGNVRRIQEEHYGNRVIATDLRNPDFAAMAETFGALGLRASGPDDLRPVLERALTHDGPSVIHVKCGPMPSPWDLILLPPARGRGDPVF